jgi:hypothetical protein
MSTDDIIINQQKISMDIGIFMEQAQNLVSLSFLCFSSRKTSRGDLRVIYSNLPHHIRHLHIPIDYWSEIKIIFERCTNLITITIYSTDSNLLEAAIQWFTENTILD